MGEIGKKADNLAFSRLAPFTGIGHRTRVIAPASEREAGKNSELPGRQASIASRPSRRAYTPLKLPAVAARACAAAWGAIWPA